MVQRMKNDYKCLFMLSPFHFFQAKLIVMRTFFPWYRNSFKKNKLSYLYYIDVIEVWREFVWGAIAGAFGEGMMHPVDTIKTRMQSQAIIDGIQVKCQLVNAFGHYSY